MTERRVAVSLDDAERARYARQLIYPDFGEVGQLCLKKAHVLIAGVGGLGSPNAVNLTCAGIGKLTLVDGDFVDISTLNRQTLHWEKDVGVPKVISGAAKLAAMNSRTEIVPLHVRITAENAAELLAGVDVVMDCLDTMETRFILNVCCVRGNIPFIHGGIRGLDGEVTTIIPGRTPCLECIYPRGLGGAKNMLFPAFGATPALVASLQTMEAIKLLAGFGELLTGKMLFISGESMEFSIMDIEKKRDCKICGEDKR
jgi:adenylyltransferase/sulfurtransferase